MVAYSKTYEPEETYIKFVCPKCGYSDYTNGDAVCTKCGFNQDEESAATRLETARQ